MTAVLDNQLRMFISEHISSVEQLEILFLVAADPDKAWTVDAVFQVIQSNRDSIEDRLKTMVAQGLLKLEGTNNYRYHPNNNEMAESVSALEAAYRRSRVKVIEAIYSPVDSAKNFADSFKFKTET